MIGRMDVKVNAEQRTVQLVQLHEDGTSTEYPPMSREQAFNFVAHLADDHCAAEFSPGVREGLLLTLGKALGSLELASP